MDGRGTVNPCPIFYQIMIAELSQRISKHPKFLSHLPSHFETLSVDIPTDSDHYYLQDHRKIQRNVLFKLLPNISGRMYFDLVSYQKIFLGFEVPADRVYAALVLTPEVILAD